MATPVLQPTFTGGELSPSLYARVDLARYGTSLRKAKNFIVRPYGGVVNRAGFGFVGEVKDSAERVRLLPFEYSSEVAYVIELGDQYARFVYRGEYVLAESGGAWSNATTYALGALVDSGGVVYKSLQAGNLNHTPASSPTWWQANPLSEVATPWTLAEIGDVAYTQSADVMYIVHPAHQPQELRRLTASSFEIKNFDNRNGPFSPINTDEAKVVASSADTGIVTVTSNVDVFTADMVGTLIYMEEKDVRNLRPWEPGWRDVALGTLCRSDGKTYRCSAIPGGGLSWYQTGSTRPIHDSGRAFDGPRDTRDTGTDIYGVGVEWEYMHSGFGIVLITAFTDAKTVTGVVTSRLPETVVGGVGSPGTTWNLTGDGATKTFTIAGAASSSTLDYTVTISGSPTQSDPYYPGGGSACVSVDMLVFERTHGPMAAGTVRVGDWLLRGNGTWGKVSYSRLDRVDGVRIVDDKLSTLECSTTAPIQSGDAFRLAPDMFGCLTPRWVGVMPEPAGTRIVSDIVRLGIIAVQHITLAPDDHTSDADADHVFLASADGVNWWAHHNIKMLEP